MSMMVAARAARAWGVFALLFTIAVAAEQQPRQHGPAAGNEKKKRGGKFHGGIPVV